MKNVLFTILGLTLLASSCVEPIGKTYSKLPPGTWRGILEVNEPIDIVTTDDEVVEEVDKDLELPFNFEVNYINEEDFTITLQNGSENIVVSDIVYGRDRATAKDTITIHFHPYGTYIKGIYEENIIEGDWYVPRKGDYKVPFRAYHGRDHRFSTLKKVPVQDISGRWEVDFNSDTDTKRPAIGQFAQKGNHITGTFLTETGDYRFLEGTVQGDKFYMSSFDGYFAILVKGKIMDKDNITGELSFGKHYKMLWEGRRNPEAKLRDAYTVTKIIDGDKPMKFTFLDLEGKEVSLDDNRYNNKVKLVKISGTWCPNCKDEMVFLQEYFKKHPSEDVVVIEVNFESGDQKRDLEKLRKYVKRSDVSYDVLYGGKASSEVTKAKLPQLEKVMSYPSLIFLDRNNMIKKIHTGFAGPATKEYEDFKTEFHKNLTQLIKE